MTSPTAGDVVVEGLLEGPAASWRPTPQEVAGALRRAGAPSTALHAVIEGGRASLEPALDPLPREQFAGDPGETLRLALEMLLQEGPRGRPPEWVSTLRTVEYLADRKRESLIAFAGVGLQLTYRETPWAAPRAGALDAVRSRWPILALVLVAAVLAAWMNRDRLVRGWKDLVGTVSPTTPSEVALEPGPFADWIDLSLEKSGGRWKVTLAPRAGFPADAAAIDRLRADGSLDRRAALNALEAGRARLRAVGEEAGGTESRTQEADLKPLREGKPSVVTLEAGSWVGRLKAVRLEP